MVGEDFYKGGKTGYVNYVGRDIHAAFRNSDAELTSANVLAVDYCPGQVKLVPPVAITTHQKRGELTNQTTTHKGFGEGTITFPEHPATSAMPWIFVWGSCATSTDFTKTFTEASSYYYFGQHIEMENTSYAIRKDALGCYRKSYTFSWSQEGPCTHAYTDGVAKVIDTSANITRPTKLDYREPFPAGQFSHTFTYNSDSLGIVVLSGSFNRETTHKTHKVGDQFITDAIKTSKDDTLTFTVRMFRDFILTDLPETASSYASALTWYGKWWKNATSDFMALSATNLWIDKSTITMKKIADEDYIYEATFNAYPAGERSAVTANSFTPTVMDDLSSTYYGD